MQEIKESHQQELYSLIESVLGLTSGTVEVSDRLGFCEWWDSLNHVTILLAIANYYQIELTIELAEKFTSIEQIEKVIYNHHDMRKI